MYRNPQTSVGPGLGPDNATRRRFGKKLWALSSDRAKEVFMGDTDVRPRTSLPDARIDSAQISQTRPYLNVNTVQSAICVETICCEMSSSKRRLRAPPI
jgi:hypothetical protein